MADTLQSKQLDKLVRRIGYSVGLEEPVDRITKLVEIYVQEGDINLALWKKLVKEGYGRKISDDLEVAKWAGNKKTQKKLGAEDHFADFYSELNLIFRRNNQIFPLYGLDILSILRRYYLHSDDKYREAIKSLLLLFFLEADGDIFLNCLLGDFNKIPTEDNLIKMFTTKKNAYLNAFISPYSRNKLLSIFKVQTSASQNNPFERRSIAKNEEIIIPEDYISKILPSRKGWATQLNLVSDSGALEELGKRLIEFLKRTQIVKDSYAAFYAYSETHKILFIDEKKHGIIPLDRKEFTRKFFASYFNRDSLTSVEPPATDGTQFIYDLLNQVMEFYRSGNIAKGMLRHQLPFQIIFPIFYIISNLDNLPNYNLETFLAEEQKSLSRKLDVINLRGVEMEGAITFKP